MDMKSSQVASSLVERVGDVLQGKEEVVRLVVVALLARGHVLVEDVPGVGKTTLARALAASLGLMPLIHVVLVEAAPLRLRSKLVGAAMGSSIATECATLMLMEPACEAMTGAGGMGVLTSLASGAPT